MVKKKKAGWWNYVVEAFSFKWNLLFFGGAVAAAALSPAPDVFLPLAAAGELVYLTGLTSLPSFQKAIDLKYAYGDKSASAEDEGEKRKAVDKLANLLSSLESGSRIRFQKLRERSLKMRRLAHGVRGGHSSEDADDLRTPGLDRLLWVFLRLLYSQQGLLRFLDATDEPAIRKQLDDQRAKLEVADKDGDERIIRSLTDAIATTELRLDNYERAQKNAEFVEIELERIESKIQALTEMAVSSQDPDYISSQVDVVADSMTQTEEAIRDLHHITGLEDLDETPSILETEMSEVVEA